MVLCQVIIIPRCTMVIIYLALGTLVLTFCCVLVMAEEFPGNYHSPTLCAFFESHLLVTSGLPSCLKINSAKLVHQRRRRTLFICGVIISMCLLSAIGLLLCDDTAYNGTSYVVPETTTTTTTPTTRTSAESTLSVAYSNLSSTMTTFEQSTQYEALSRFIRSTNDSEALEGSCVHKEYVVFTWVLCLVSLATALKLYYLVKAIMALGMVAFYTSLILIRFRSDNLIFSLNNLKETGMPLGVQMLILLITFLVMVCYHARLVEVS